MWRWKKRRRPDSLVHSAARVYSQNDEDGMLLEVFKRIGEGTKYAVEFGISSGDECCTRNLIAHHGWGGLVMDGSEANIARARQTYAPFPVRVGCHFITLESIVSLFRSYDVPQRHDLLVVDIDGNDYWVLGALLQHYQPRVIVAEYNGRWWPPTEWVMSYRPDHVWDWTCYGGASLTSLNKLCTAYGYRLVGCDPCGVNGFFVHRDELGDRFPDARYGVGYHFVRLRAGIPCGSMLERRAQVAEGKSLAGRLTRMIRSRRCCAVAARSNSRGSIPGRSSAPPILEHRAFPSLAGRKDIILGAEHFGSLEIGVDLEPNLPAQMMRPQLADGGERLLATHPGDAKQIAEIGGLAVPALALQGSAHRRGIVAGLTVRGRGGIRRVGTCPFPVIRRIVILSGICGGPPGDRTRDTLIKSQVLYH